MYVDKIETYEDNPYADFGTIIHEEIEKYLNGNDISIENVGKKITQRWQLKQYDSHEYIKKITESRATIGSKYTHEYLNDWIQSSKNILSDFPKFMDETFPGWEILKAEDDLYQPINNFDLKFKGFIDCVIMTPKSKTSNKVNFWILDWKTTGKNGWYYQKKKEFSSLAQVGLYKKYWSEKSQVDLKDIKTAFVFLKRGAPLGSTCEIFKVSTGPKFLEKTDKLVESMIKNVKKGFTLKNYNSCKFCSFKNTEHCSGNGW
tara:strand:+ start:531 stop:1310 length:780 start_codon:yes stop_codon:yes gene_type:complete